MAANKSVKGGLSKEQYAKLLADIDSEDQVVEKEKPPEKTLAELMKEQRARERADEEKMRLMAEQKVKDEAQAKEDEKARKEAEKAAVLARQIAAMKEEERRQEEEIREIERKTKRFFKYNIAARGEFKGQLVRGNTGRRYFGDFANRGSDYWVPHGEYGEYTAPDGLVTHEGEFTNGLMHGGGTIRFPNGDAWTGNFVLDEPHGLGVYRFALDDDDDEYGRQPDPPRIALYHRHNVGRVCWLDELIPGTRIRLLDKATHCREPTGVILGEGDKKGKFRVKLHHGVVKVLDLANERFELETSGLPRMHLLEHFTRLDDAPVSRYDYDADRRNPHVSDHTENFYHDDSAAKAKKEGAEAEQLKKQRERWAKERANQAAADAKAKAKAANDGEVQAAVAQQAAEKAKEDAEKAAYADSVAKAKEEMAEKRRRQAEMLKETKQDGAGAGAAIEPP